ncbi:MAG: sulfatase, partial [Myxococcota bacterium]
MTDPPAPRRTSLRNRLPNPRMVLAVLSAAAIVVSLVFSIDLARPPERIILVVIDTLRRDFVSAYGERGSTPHMDALAARGQLFTHARASFHQTTMSMAALFTGRTPSIETTDPTSTLRWNSDTWCGMARFADADGEVRCIPEAVPTLAESLRDAGYWTIGVVSNGLMFEPSGFERGFGDWTEVGPREQVRPRDGPGVGALRAWAPVTNAVIEALNRRPSNRLFLYVHYMDVHDYPFRRVDYRTAVGAADRGLGVLLKNLEEGGLLENATVIVTSDHGERLGERHPLKGRPGHYGNPAFQELLEVPLIIAPAVVDDPSEPVRIQDLHGLIQEIAGLGPRPDPELAPGELYVGERRYQTYRNGRWKTTLRREGRQLFLFDLAADPDERRNVAEFSPHIAAAHRKRIREISSGMTVSSDRSDRELTERERRTLEVLG